MSIIFLKDGTELLQLVPVEFQRVYTLRPPDDETELPKLGYSHSDIVVELENGSQAMVEICEGMLGNGSYVIKAQPTDTTFDIRITKSGSMDSLKKIIFMTFPKLPTNDYYCENIIFPYEPISKSE